MYCESCWRERFTVRSLALPIVEPVGEDWRLFREALKDSWAQATAAANWMVTELYARDIRRNQEDRMPPMARVYLYPEARVRFPRLAPQTAVSIENSVQSSYRAARFEVIWTASRSLPTYRYPMPLPVHNQSWEATVASERPVVRVRMGDRWWSLRLKGGPRFRRQIEGYRQVVSGQAVKGELSLYRVRAGEGKFAGRPNGDQTVRYTVMCKMVAWFPREWPRQVEREAGTLKVRTAADMLLAAINAADDCVWRYHGDHVRRWAAEHQKTLQNLAGDRKAEHRPQPAFADRRTAAALKYRKRMSSAVGEIAALLVGYAERRNFSAIEYDDSVRSFCAQFPYAALRHQIQAKCATAGLEFRSVDAMAQSQRHEDTVETELEDTISGPPVGPARSMADTLAGLSTRGRL